MATTLHTPLPTPPQSSPPTPPSAYPAFPRLPPGSSPSISRNDSTSSSRSTATLPSRPSSVQPSEPSEPGSSRRGSGEAIYHSPTPQGIYGGRGFMRNGPRSRQGTLPLPAIVTSNTDSLPSRASSTPLPAHAPTYVPTGLGLSPTTPRASRFADPDELDGNGPVRVTISADSQTDYGYGSGSGPSSPISSRGMPSPTVDRKGRTLSVGAGQGRDASRDRERRQSQTSAKSTSSGRVRETPRDYVFGEELGRGSYSTVVQAIRTSSSTASPTSPKPPKQYAIKIINQAHLVQEKKTKYAMIERDALVRLGAPRSPTTGTSGGRGHRRGLSSSSSGGYTIAAGAPRNRKSTASISSSAGVVGSGRRDSSSLAPGDRTADRLSIAVSDSGSSVALGSSVPLSPVLAGRRPSRSAEPPEVVPERSEDGDHATIPLVRSRPPSPVTEEPSHPDDLTPPRPIRLHEDALTPSSSPLLNSYEDRTGDRSRDRRQDTPRARRTSQAPSERSVKSAKGSPHPGVIRLHSTFNDATSLYFVLDLASNGELLGFIRKYGSLDLISARYYAAQLIDTIEFMHERGVIHRDLKPENILLDDEMRLKITDFGSAKLQSKDGKDGKEEAHADEGRKRSFVGSADFVSPEVLRNESAGFASDVWAFGCILYQFLVGRPPFRGATDYLTFQKILKKEMDFPEGFDDDAKALVEQVLHLEPSQRPSPSEIKSHPFFSSIEWSTLWTSAAPRIATGLTKPVVTLANVQPDSDIWAVFEDEVSDGGFPYDEEDEPGGPGVPGRPHSPPPPHTVPRPHAHRGSPLYDQQAAADAVASVDWPSQISGDVSRFDHESDLEPPRPAWIDGVPRKRGWSRGSHRTSSSGSGNRTALAGLLETMGIHNRPGSSRTSNSAKSDEARPLSRSSGQQAIHPQDLQQRLASDLHEASLLLANERITFTSPVHVKSSALPHFLAKGPKRRQLILTDFPRLIAVKEESSSRPSSAAGMATTAPTARAGAGSGTGTSTPFGSPSAAALPNTAQVGLSVKSECVFVVRPSTGTVGTNASTGTGLQGSPLRENTASAPPNRVLDVSEKGPRGFVVQTASQTFPYIADTPELRNQWMSAIKRITT
ncbi:pkb-activating kinase-like protein [Saitozyma podzolica]|uniref:non-specific serine/threonine protein kinase n=1 Tax=Saitozyma podzolica TaxID=1890683 RepID=A0A427YNP9_9TREE|nr:pkb-activating kinase-like protein [Saitozyma podzolica]